MECKGCGKLTSEQFCGDDCFRVETRKGRYIDDIYNNRPIKSNPLPELMCNIDITNVNNNDKWQGLSDMQALPVLYHPVRRKQ